LLAPNNLRQRVESAGRITKEFLDVFKPPQRRWNSAARRRCGSCWSPRKTALADGAELLRDEENRTLEVLGEQGITGRDLEAQRRTAENLFFRGPREAETHRHSAHGRSTLLITFECETSRAGTTPPHHHTTPHPPPPPPHPTPNTQQKKKTPQPNNKKQNKKTTKNNLICRRQSRPADARLLMPRPLFRQRLHPSRSRKSAPVPERQCGGTLNFFLQYGASVAGSGSRCCSTGASWSRRRDCDTTATASLTTETDVASSTRPIPSRRTNVQVLIYRVRPDARVRPDKASALGGGLKLSPSPQSHPRLGRSGHRSADAPAVRYAVESERLRGMKTRGQSGIAVRLGTRVGALDNAF